MDLYFKTKYFLFSAVLQVARNLFQNGDHHRRNTSYVRDNSNFLMFRNSFLLLRCRYVIIRFTEMKIFDKKTNNTDLYT